MFRKIAEILRLSEAGEIARRYFIINFFDGILTALGVIIGIYAVGIHDIQIITAAVIGAAIAMFVSGFSGAYISERAEKAEDLKRIERAMLRKMGKTKIGEAARKVPFIVAFVNGLSPAISSIVIIIPCAFALAGLLQEAYVFPFVLTISFSLLFILGIFLGRIAKENTLFFGLKTLIIGAVAAGLCMLVKFLF